MGYVPTKVCRIVITLYQGSVPILENVTDFEAHPETAEHAFDGAVHGMAIDVNPGQTKELNSWG
jgi:hypothetical protein